MLLKKWLDNNGLTYQQFADKIGIHRQTIVNLMGGRDIRLSVAAKIQDATLGVVTCRELLSQAHDDKAYTKKEKQQQQNQAPLQTPVGTDNAT